MEILEVVGKYKNWALNIAVVCLAAYLAVTQIHKRQVAEADALKMRSADELQKNSILEEIAKREKRIGIYKESLSKKDASLVINNLGSLAQEAGIKIISARPLLEQRSADYVKHSFAMTAAAEDYHAIGDFISRVENYPDIYAVEALEIKAGSQPGKLVLDIVVSSISYLD